MKPSTCQLPTWKQCCCTCKSRLIDYHHCTTTGKDENGCVCNKPRGYICVADGDRAFSGWTEHGICEMWAKKNV